MVHLADQPSDQLEDNLTNNSTNNNIKYMNQNQINRLYKVAKRVPNELEVMAKNKAQDRAAMQQMYVKARNNYDDSYEPFTEDELMDPSQLTALKEQAISGRPVPNGASHKYDSNRAMIAAMGRKVEGFPGSDYLKEYSGGMPLKEPQPTEPTGRHMGRQRFMAENPRFVEGDNSAPFGLANNLGPASPGFGITTGVNPNTSTMDFQGPPTPGAASKSGFSLDRFVAIVKDRARQISDMAGRGAQGISTLAQDPRVQIGAGIGAAGLAGYGIYKHLNKKDKKKDRAYA